MSNIDEAITRKRSMKTTNNNIMNTMQNACKTYKPRRGMCPMDRLYYPHSGPSAQTENSSFLWRKMRLVYSVYRYTDLFQFVNKYKCSNGNRDKEQLKKNEITLYKYTSNT